MNSFLVAQNAMQSFNNGLKQKRKGRKGKAAQVQKYQPKLACSFCERARKDEPPWYWSEARRRREAGEWCKREMLSDTSKVQAVGRLTLCPLHEEDMMEADSNWLEGNILLKSSVWAACEAADEARANAENRDICHRCKREFRSAHSTFLAVGASQRLFARRPEGFGVQHPVDILAAGPTAGLPDLGATADDGPYAPAGVWAGDFASDPNRRFGGERRRSCAGRRGGLRVPDSGRGGGRDPVGKRHGERRDGRGWHH